MEVSPQQDAALQAVARWLKSPHAAGLPPLRLCRHRQDDACEEDRRRLRRRRALRRVHRQGRAGDAQPRLRQCAHHPFADLPAARRKGGEGDRRAAAGLRAEPVERGQEGEARHRRRMFHGRREARSRPPLLRHEDSGARRSGPASAGEGGGRRRLLHRAGARRHADRDSPAGAGEPDHRAFADGARGRPPRLRQLRREPRHHPRRDRGGRRAYRRPGARRAEPHEAQFQPAHPRSEGLRGFAACLRRQARMPQEQLGEGASERRALARLVGRHAGRRRRSTCWSSRRTRARTALQRKSAS